MIKKIAIQYASSTTLKELASSLPKLVELKGMAALIRTQRTLFNTIGSPEAKNSSKVENIAILHSFISSQFVRVCPLQQSNLTACLL